MDETHINRLSKRHLDVLRGVSALKKTKQIAVDLGIAPGTVDGYIAEAVRILGATDRGDAARLFRAYEEATPAEAAVPGESDPWKSGGQSSGVGAGPPTVTGPGRPDVDPDAIQGRNERHQPRRSALGLLPFRQPGQRNNDLPIVARLLWIPAIAVILAVGFGMLASGLKVFADLIERL